MFAYCRNNPVCRIDILGTFDVDCYDDDPLDDEDRLEDGLCISGYGFDAQQAMLDEYYLGGYNYGGNNYNLLPNWTPTGRSEPQNLEEQIAMKAARTNPQDGKSIIKTLNDPRLVGYEKFARIYETSKGKIEVHYVGNRETNTFGDFKFK